MIDRRWLQSVICLAGGDLSGKDLDQLCQELGVQEEVLPYLLLTAGSFSGWPITQAAFRGAAKAVTRPSQMRGASALGALSSAQRRGLRQSIGAVLTLTPEATGDPAIAPTDINLRDAGDDPEGASTHIRLQATDGDAEATPIDIRLRATDDIARFRSAASGPNAEPQLFISNE
ncbi:MAG: hypothetical protein K2X59_06195 [Sphingomonas sp.]|nr:hypothetical protein [Sphingomonas sp.]